MDKKEYSEIEEKEKLFDHYYHNFEKNFRLNNLSKSTEFLWGAIHSLLFAIALTYEKKLTEHRKVIEFARELSTIEGDENIFIGIKTGEVLHANFYHNFLDKENVEIKRKDVDNTIKKLGEILEKRKSILAKEKIE